jgi:ubiquinone biosynthesis protein
MDSSMNDRGFAATRFGQPLVLKGREFWRFSSLARISGVAAILLRSLVWFLAHSASARLAGRHRGLIELGECIASTFESLGGGFVKIGQILSTRPEIPEELTTPLRRLQDSMAPFPAAVAQTMIEGSLGCSLSTIFRSFDPRPIGSASMAQVHRAVLLSTGAEVAVKVRRPNIARTISVDSRVFVALSRIISCLPTFRRIPVVEATQQVALTVEAQASFWLEAERHRQFAALFESGVPVRVPRLVDEYCTDEVLVMEYIPNLVRITDPSLDEATHRNAVIAGLRGLYQMLFNEGLVHCDLHPGNVLVSADGVVAIIDFGFSTAMRPSERAAFARLFLSIALNDGATAARIVRDTAMRMPPELDRATFESEISDLISRSSGLQAGDFLVSAFVTSLFKIQRKHGIYASPSFTLAILSLTVYEGVIRHRCADLHFQREAVPILFASLQGKG